jgi:hypothetical protein
MFKFALLVVVFITVGVVAYGQQTIKGRVLEFKSRVGLVSINVKNLQSKQTAITDSKGSFTIKASPNDLLVFKGFAYQNDTLLVTSYNEFEVFLQPQEHVLQDVKVSGKGMDGPSMAFYDPYFHGQTTAYQTDANGNFKGGVNFRFWYWKKDERKKKRREKMLKDEQVREQIAKVFIAKNLAAFVPLKGAEMDTFIRLYTPTVNMYQANDFVLPAYLNISYKKFMQLPAEKRQFNADSSVFSP